MQDSYRFLVRIANLFRNYLSYLYCNTYLYVCQLLRMFFVLYIVVWWEGNMWSALFTTGYLTQTGKKSQYVRRRIVLTLPVSNWQGIFLSIFRTKTLKKNKKSVKMRTISSKNTNKSIQTGNNNHRRIPLFFTSEKPKMFFLKS